MTPPARLLPDDDPLVSFAPRRLSLVDRWRFALRRAYTRSGDPVRSALVRMLLGTLYFTVLGFILGSVVQSATAPGILAFAGLVGSCTLYPLRFLAVRRLILGQFAADELFTVGTHPAGLTVATGTLFLTIYWSAVRQVRVTRREVVVDMRTAYVVSVPLSAFKHDGHLATFVQAVKRGIASARPEPPR